MNELHEVISRIVYDAEFGDGRWGADTRYEPDPRDYYSEPYINFRRAAQAVSRDILAAVREALLNPEWGGPVHQAMSRIVADQHVYEFREGGPQTHEAAMASTMVALADAMDAAFGEGAGRG